MSIFKRHAWTLSRLWVLNLFGSLAHALYPFATGLAINGVLDGDYQAIGWLVGCHGLMLVSEISFMRIDTRVFARIYGGFASELVLAAHREGLPAEQAAARASLSREYVEFFEKDIRQLLMTTTGLLVGVAALLWFDAMIGALCALLIPPLFLIYHWLAKRSVSLNRRLNDRLEREVGILQNDRPMLIKRHFRALGGWRIKLSDAEATSFAWMETAVIILFVAALLRLASEGTVRPGDIYAVFAYIWRIVGMLDTVPVLVQRLAKIRNLDRRFASGQTGGNRRQA
ncbi:MAG: ABC transporter six-transmembrane domain-containing protein [Sphingorhabdus sp.]